MGFAERSIEACKRDWSSECVDESHVRDVLKSHISEASWALPYIGNEYPSDVRIAAARIIVEKHPDGTSHVADIALAEQDREVLWSLLQLLGKKGAGLDALESLIISEDTMIRDAAVEMFRRAGKVDSIFPLVFNDDDGVVARIKRYINEAGQH